MSSFSAAACRAAAAAGTVSKRDVVQSVREAACRPAAPGPCAVGCHKPRPLPARGGSGQILSVARYLTIDSAVPARVSAEELSERGRPGRVAAPIAKQAFIATGRSAKITAIRRSRHRWTSSCGLALQRDRCSSALISRVSPAGQLSPATVEVYLPRSHFLRVLIHAGTVLSPARSVSSTSSFSACSVSKMHPTIVFCHLMQ